jgi:hypothetical protein
MSNEIATITPAGTAVSLPAEITEQTKADSCNAWAPATQRIYKNGWRVWTDWAALYGVVALPADPERVADFLSNLGRARKMSTLKGYLSAISAAHRSAKVQFDPEAEAIKRVMKGLGKNKVGDLRKAAPLLPQHVQAALKADAKPTLLDYRDCALLGLGLAMAARRSELVGLDLGIRGDGDNCVGVLEVRDDGAVVRLHKGKTITGGPHEIFIQPGVALKAVRRHHTRHAALPRCQQESSRGADPAVRPDGVACGQEALLGGGPRYQALQRPLAALGCHHRRVRGRLGGVDHQADQPPQVDRGVGSVQPAC